ncbi:MAG: diguanylate cyclase [Betaproteobacteria bacterium]|nr:diguanylate cyclase [Betaproteobacteria bacterium]
MEIIDQNRFDELKASGQLPSPQGVALAILKLMQQDEVTLQEIAHVIQTDPALTGRLIKFANSAHSGTRRPIVSISEAVMFIGLPMVRQLVLGLSVLSGSRIGKCKAFDYDEFWSRSLATAIANQALSARAKTAAEETFTCGLLSNIGSLAMATLFPDKYAEVLAAAAGKTADELIGLEQAEFACDHNEMTVALLKEWGFPEIFLGIVLHHENPDKGDFQEGDRTYTLVHALRLSAFLAKVCLADENSRRLLLPRLYVLGARLGIDSEDLMTLSDRVVTEWQEWGRLLDVPTRDLPPFAEMAASFPVAPDVDHCDTQAQTAKPDLPMRILVVDDDKAVSLYLKKILTDGGHTVTTASNGREAMGKVLESNPQIIISDWVMPEIDGLALCKFVRSTAEGRKIYFLILTSLENEDSLVEAFEAGADDYVVKPLNPKVLVARLRAGQRMVHLQDVLTQEREEMRGVASELAVANRRFQRLALTDSLTLLPNRRFGMDRMEQEWAAAERNGRPLTFMLLDLDHFKQVNDNHGHDVGDHALQQAAKILKGCSRTQDLVARVGGEEFLIICPDTNINAAVQHAERIRKTFEATMLKAGEVVCKLTASVGVAEKIATTATFTELLKVADQALYLAKKNGRNRVVAAGQKK